MAIAFGDSFQGRQKNVVQNSPPQANMQPAPGMRPQGAPTAANGRFNIEELKNRAVMVQRAIKDLDARRLTLVANGGANPQTEYEVNTLKVKIVEHQQLLQRIGRMMQMAGLTVQNAMQGPPDSDMGNM